MKLRIQVDGQDYSFDLTRNGPDSQFTLHSQPGPGAPGVVQHVSGSASVIEVVPGVFSVLLGHRSFTVRVVVNGGELEVWTGAERHTISVADARDRSGRSKKIASAGPLEISAQMPGKVIKLLVEPGAKVHAGQGVIVVEAMKMQNEMKSPKDGIVSRIQALEGATVSPGETLLVIE